MIREENFFMDVESGRRRRVKLFILRKRDHWEELEEVSGAFFLTPGKVTH